MSIVGRRSVLEWNTGQGRLATTSGENERQFDQEGTTGRSIGRRRCDHGTCSERLYLRIYNQEYMEGITSDSARLWAPFARR